MHALYKVLIGLIVWQIVMEGVATVPCSAVRPTPISEGGFSADLHPLTLRIYPAHDGVRQESYVAWNFSSFAERARGTASWPNYNPSGSTVYVSLLLLSASSHSPMSAVHRY